MMRIHYLVVAAVFLLAHPAGGAGGTAHGMELLQWPGTQKAGTGCLRHSDCATGHFCMAETPPEQECTTERGWKVRACGTCRKCADCVCNEDAVDATCPQDRCPAAPSSVPRALEGSFHGAMRLGQSLCYVSFDFHGGVFTQISSELSPAAKAEMGINEDLTTLTAKRWSELSGGLPLTDDRGNMCSVPTLGVKSGIYKIVKDSWPVVVELETTDGFIEMANDDGKNQYATDATERIFGTPLRGTVARLEIDMVHCPFFVMKYTLPASIYYRGSDPAYFSVPGYTWVTTGDMGDGFYANFRHATFSMAYAGDADGLKPTAHDAALGFSRTRETFAGDLIFGSSTSALALSELDHVRCRFRYHTSPHKLGLQQFRLQTFGCQKAGPHRAAQSGQSLRSNPFTSPFTRVSAASSPGQQLDIEKAPKKVAIRAVSNIEEDPGRKTEDWVLKGRGVQYNISNVEILNLGHAFNSNWWSEVRVVQAYVAAGKPKDKNGAPFLDVQGISVNCTWRRRQFNGTETRNGTDFTPVLGTRWPVNYEGITKCIEADDEGVCALIEVRYAECTAEFYCQGFPENVIEERQWCKCPPGTYSSTGFGPCSRCTTQTCDSSLAQTSCRTCPSCIDANGSTPTLAAGEFCRCPLGYKSLTFTPPGNSWNGVALGPCEICPHNAIQPWEGWMKCLACPPSPLMTQTTRYSQNPTWPWQRNHSQHTLIKGATGKHFHDSCIDIMGFFEEFVPVGQQLHGRSIRVRTTFEIPQENANWISSRDIIAIYKGSQHPTCDETRSFESCTSGEKLTRQVAWGYASVLQTSTAYDNTMLSVPGPSPLLFNSLTFQFSSAGPGTYYMLYHSHEMNRIVLQVDYNTERDYVSPGDVFTGTQSFPLNTEHAILGFGLEKCPPGYFIDTRSSSGCAECPPGLTTFQQHSAECIRCPVGTYGGKDGVCSPCIVDTSTFGGAATNESCIRCNLIYNQLKGQVVDDEMLDGEKLKQRVRQMRGCDNFVPDITVVITTPPPIECGNKIIEAGEECDDRNRNSFDGCHECKAQKIICGDGVKIDVGTAFDWGTSPPRLLPEIASEMCDDGNNEDGDGCSRECTIEALWDCTVYPTDLKSSCRKMCGNGLVNFEFNEKCDDFNVQNLDGCSAGCQVECGYRCTTRAGLSTCKSTCGDGILASNEECELFTVDKTVACDIVTCKVVEGWYCERIPCDESTIELGLTIKQRCVPVCGDRLINKGHELCDLGDPSAKMSATKDGMDWPRPWTGGIGPDRGCNEHCKPNRDFQCFGGACASRQVPLVMKQDMGMPLLDMILNGHDLSHFNGALLEGLQLTVVQNLSGTPHNFAKLVILDPTNRGGPRTYAGAVLASFSSSLDKLENETKLYQCTYCAGHEVVTARRANISVVKGALAFPVSCTWTMRPLDQISGRLLMDVSALSLANEESLVFEEVNQQGTGTTGKVFLRFDGPIELRHLGLSPKVNFSRNEELPFDTHFDLPWNVRIRFSAGNHLSHHQADSQSTSTPYRFSIHLMPSVDKRSVGAKYTASGASLKFVGGVDDDVPNRASDERLAILLNYTGRRLVMKVQGYHSYGIPCDFPQDFKSMVLPMETEESGHRCSTADGCQDGVNPSAMLDSDAATFYEGSWEGQCITTLSPEFAECKIVLRIIGIDIEQHVTGRNCPAEFQGKKSGLIKVISRSALLPVKSATQELLLKYSEMTVLWLYGATQSEAGIWINGLISTGPNDFRSPNDRLTIIWGSPGASSWPNDNFFLPNVPLERCSLSKYSAFHPEINVRLPHSPPFWAVNDAVKQRGLKQKTEALEISWVVSCNNSLTNILELSQQSADCKALVDTLLLRDPLQMLPASLGGELCLSRCINDLDLAVESALQVCRAHWERVWDTSAYHSMLFKQLLTLAALKYWIYLDCASNRHRKSCVEAASMMSLKMSDCSAFQGASLPPRHPFEFHGSSSLETKFCSPACKSALDMHVQTQHCCVSTLEDADHDFRSILYHPYLQHIEADLKIRSDPFDLREPNVSLKYWLAPANNTAWTDVCPTCSIHPVDQSFHVSESATSADEGSVTSLKCPASRVASSCAMGLACGSLNWPQSCCNALKCTRGSKPYPGACACTCPKGFSGVACDKTGMFAAFSIEFPGETLESFNYHKLSTFVIDLSTQVGVKTKDVQWEEPTESVLRRGHGSGERRLLAPAVQVLFRVIETNFMALEKMALATTKAMCKPDSKYLQDFPCDHGPSQFYNGSLLNPIKPPPPQPPPTPPPEVVSTKQEQTTVNLLAILISLCIILLIMLVAGCICMRLRQEPDACQQWRDDEISLTSLCCLVFCIKPPGPALLSSGKEEWGNTQIFDQQLQSKYEKKSLKSAKEVSVQVEKISLQFTNTQRTPRRGAQRKDEDQETEVPGNEEIHGVEIVELLEEPEGDVECARPKLFHGVEFSTKTQLRRVEQAIKSSQLQLSALSSRGFRPEVPDGIVMTRGRASPDRKFSASPQANSSTLIDFTAAGSLSPKIRAVEGESMNFYELASPSVRPLGRHALERQLDQLSEQRSPSRVTAELGFKPIPVSYTPRLATPLSPRDPSQHDDGKPAASSGVARRPGATLITRNPRQHSTNARLGSVYRSSQEATSAQEILQQLAELKRGRREPGQRDGMLVRKAVPSPALVEGSAADSLDADSLLGSVRRV